MLIIHATILFIIHATILFIIHATILFIVDAAAGGSDDYAKGSAGVKYSYTLELRDTGRYGFVLPENLIIPTCEETMDAFRVFAQHLKTAPQT